jgi:hypothetical protein
VNPRERHRGSSAGTRLPLRGGAHATITHAVDANACRARPSRADPIVDRVPVPHMRDDELFMQRSAELTCP